MECRVWVNGEEKRINSLSLGTGFPDNMKPFNEIIIEGQSIIVFTTIF